MRRTAAATVSVLVAGLLSGPAAGPATAGAGPAAAVTLEAEDATISQGVVESTHPGFTGRGFVNSDNVVGAHVEWAVTRAAGATVTLRFRYANGAPSDRSARLAVGGIDHGTLAFPPTGGWSSWRTQDATASLPAGSSTVRITSTTGGGLANIDSLVVDDGQGGGGHVLPGLAPNLVAFYDFEHPAAGNAAVEVDQGRSGTDLRLINGGAAMRVADAAYPGSGTALQTRQVRPAVASNDDWKAGVWSASGVPTLSGFSRVTGATVMGWFKLTGQNPAPNSNSASPGDVYGAVGLAGVLAGNSDGHHVRALLEVFTVRGQLHLVALGRRVDTGGSQVFAANENWRTLLPANTWVFLAASFDFDRGTMALYRNGRPLPGFHSVAGDPWAINGPPEPDLTSAANPRGIKIGGSFPQNTRENNACNCRMDSLMFLDRAVSAAEVEQQYRLVTE